MLVIFSPPDSRRIASTHRGSLATPTRFDGMLPQKVDVTSTCIRRGRSDRGCLVLFLSEMEEKSRSPPSFLRWEFTPVDDRSDSYFSASADGGSSCNAKCAYLPQQCKIFPACPAVHPRSRLQYGQSEFTSSTLITVIDSHYRKRFDLVEGTIHPVSSSTAAFLRSPNSLVPRGVCVRTTRDAALE